MALNRTAFNALVDDDGSNTTGTPWNKAQINAVLLNPTDAEIARMDGAVGSAGLPAVGGDIVLTTDAIVRRNTADGADVGRVSLAGGGARAGTRGGVVDVYGNEVTPSGVITPGGIVIVMGAVAGATVQIGGGGWGASTLVARGDDGVISLPYGRIQFPATPTTSTDPNTLDDYKEATWTPVDASGAGLVLNSASGQFVKVGQLVIAQFKVTYPSTANASQVTIGGLPVAVQGFGAAIVGYSTIGFPITLLVTGSTILAYKDAGVLTNTQISTQELRGTAIYRSAT